LRFIQSSGFSAVVWNTCKSCLFLCQSSALRVSIVAETTIVCLGNAASMIVCSCNVFTDRDVRTAVTGNEPPRTAGQVYGCLGCSPQCGRCARTIRRIMDEALSSASCGQGCRIACAHMEDETGAR